MTQWEFKAWPKISRLEAETMTITEKIDGTNACVVITDDGEIYAQSRTRIITPESDNFGFAAWVQENAERLDTDLGVGRHYGEWFGAGIQRRYGLDHKKFALFNAHRFAEAEPHFVTPNLTVVPILYTGPVELDLVRDVAFDLYEGGSKMVPGFANPEGVVVHFRNGGATYKINDAVQGEKHR
jgi:hypothetical protein